MRRTVEHPDNQLGDEFSYALKQAKKNIKILQSLETINEALLERIESNIVTHLNSLCKKIMKGLNEDCKENKELYKFRYYYFSFQKLLAIFAKEKNKIKDKKNCLITGNDLTGKSNVVHLLSGVVDKNALRACLSKEASKRDLSIKELVTQIRHGHITDFQYGNNKTPALLKPIDIDALYTQVAGDWFEPSVSELGVKLLKWIFKLRLSDYGKGLLLTEFTMFWLISGINTSSFSFALGALKAELKAADVSIVKPYYGKFVRLINVYHDDKKSNTTTTIEFFDGNGGPIEGPFYLAENADTDFTALVEGASAGHYFYGGTKVTDSEISFFNKHGKDGSAVLHPQTDVGEQSAVDLTKLSEGRYFAVFSSVVDGIYKVYTSINKDKISSPEKDAFPDIPAGESVTNPKVYTINEGTIPRVLIVAKHFKNNKYTAVGRICDVLENGNLVEVVATDSLGFATTVDQMHAESYPLGNGWHLDRWQTMGLDDEAGKIHIHWQMWDGEHNKVGEQGKINTGIAPPPPIDGGIVQSDREFLQDNPVSIAACKEKDGNTVFLYQSLNKQGRKQAVAVLLDPDGETLTKEPSVICSDPERDCLSFSLVPKGNNMLFSGVLKKIGDDDGVPVSRDVTVVVTKEENLSGAALSLLPILLGMAAVGGGCGLVAAFCCIGLIGGLTACRCYQLLSRKSLGSPYRRLRNTDLKDPLMAKELQDKSKELEYRKNKIEIIPDFWVDPVDVMPEKRFEMNAYGDDHDDGAGSFAKFYKGRLKREGGFGIKLYDLNEQREERLERLRQEYDALHKVGDVHDHIVHFKGVYKVDNNKVGFVMTDGGKNLLEIIISLSQGAQYAGRKKLKKLDILNIAAQMSRGVLYLHDKKNIISTDISMTNILVDGNFKVRNSDFSEAKNFDDYDEGIYRNFTQSTSGFEAPELMELASSYRKSEYIDQQCLTPAVDIFSIGVIFLSLFYDEEEVGEKFKVLCEKNKGEKPFVGNVSGSTDYAVRFRALLDIDRECPNINLDSLDMEEHTDASGKCLPKPKIKFPKRMLKLLKLCIEEQASNRPTINEVSRTFSEVFKKYKNKIDTKKQSEVKKGELKM